MKVLLQRVSSASVKVNGTVISSIGRGILAFVGVEKGDTEAEARWCAEKTVHLRIFADEGGRMNLSLLETGGELLAVSQFTLCAEVSRGRRPRPQFSSGGSFSIMKVTGPSLIRETSIIA